MMQYIQGSRLIIPNGGTGTSNHNNYIATTSPTQRQIHI